MRFVGLSTLTLLAVLTVSACSQATSSPVPLTPVVATVAASPSPSPLPTPTPTATALPTLGVAESALQGLTIQAWQAFSGPAADLFARQVAEFNSTNQWGIVVQQSGYGDYTSLLDGVNPALDSGQPPDLVAALPEQILGWDAHGSVIDLDLYISDPQWGLPDAVRTDIPSIFWAQDEVDGRQLGLPAQRSAHFIFYNQTWAQELGFNSPPVTADQFRQQACAANASFRKDTDPTNDGYGGWIVDTSWQTDYSWLLAFNGGVEDGGQYGFRTDPNLSALQFVKSLFDAHCAWLSTEQTPFDSFARRSALFISADLSEVHNELDSMARLKNSDYWTVIPFPGPQQQTLVTYGSSFAVLKSTPEKQLAAWLFASWLLSPENQSQWVEATGLFPLRTSSLDMIGPYRTALPEWDAAIGYLSRAQNVPQLASWRQVRYVLEDGLTTIFQTNLPAGKLTGALEQMDSLAQELK